MFEQSFKNIDNILHTDSGCGTELDYVEPVLVYALKNRFNQTDNDNIDVLGKEEVAVYFNKNMPARKNKRLNENDISKVVQVLKREQ